MSIKFVTKFKPSTVSVFEYGTKIARFIPEEIGIKAVELGAQLASKKDSDRSRLVKRNLERVLDRNLSQKEAAELVAQTYKSYARYWFLGARVKNWSPSRLNNVLVCEGFEYIKDAVREKRGVVIALAHLGNWEVGGAWLARQGYPMFTVAEMLEQPGLFEWFQKERWALGLTALPNGSDTAVKLSRHLKSGGVVGLLCDRDIDGTGIDVEFFGERTTLPAGPATLALRNGADLLTAGIYTGKAGGPTGFISKVNSPIKIDKSKGVRKEIYRVTQEIAYRLEDLIRVDPTEWHLFQPNWPSDRGDRGDRIDRTQS